MLYKGCPKGEDVKEWQESLFKLQIPMINDLGKPQVPDGDFGSGTFNGTNLFKKSVGLVQDGKVDTITYAKMLNKLRTLPSNKDEIIKKDKQIDELNEFLRAKNLEIVNLKSSAVKKEQEVLLKYKTKDDNINKLLAEVLVLESHIENNPSIKEATVGELIDSAYKKFKPAIDTLLNMK